MLHILYLHFIIYFSKTNTFVYFTFINFLISLFVTYFVSTLNSNKLNNGFKLLKETRYNFIPSIVHFYDPGLVSLLLIFSSRILSIYFICSAFPSSTSSSFSIFFTLCTSCITARRAPVFPFLLSTACTFFLFASGFIIYFNFNDRCNFIFLRVED